MSTRVFPYFYDPRFTPFLRAVGLRPERDGVRVTDDRFEATFGWLRLLTPRANIAGGHVTEGYAWYKAIGARLSLADDGLTFGTNARQGVCVHFHDRVPAVIGWRPHSALTVTVADCVGLLAAIEQA